MHRRPPRLQSFDYRGGHRYFVTLCTRDRRPVFAADRIISAVFTEILRTCAERDLDVLAYVFMPDHVHLLIEGRSAQADFLGTMTLLRQRTAIVFRRLTGEALWQDGYFERVLRREEHTFDVVRYILWNPVRAGLARDPAEYPYSWSAYRETGV